MTDMNHSSHTLGLRKQARLAYEPGFSDIEIENSIIAAILGENAVRFIAMCQAAGVRAIDFRDKENQRCWEAIEKIKNANMLQSERVSITSFLRKELGEAKKQYINKREQQGKKNAPCDLKSLIQSLLLKARLRRAVEATQRGFGLREGPGAAATGNSAAGWSGGGGGLVLAGAAPGRGGGTVPASAPGYGGAGRGVPVAARPGMFQGHPPATYSAMPRAPGH